MVRHGPARNVPDDHGGGVARPERHLGAARGELPMARGKRQQNTERIRRALFDAAARVVGELGYAEASIARITEAAGVAQGTFYNYFASRQDLLNQLLPTLGKEMLAHVAAEVHGIEGEAEREDRRFAAFFGFLEQRPAFFRILNEAELFAPQGFRQYFENTAASYLAALRHAHLRGRLPGFAEDELEPLVFLLMAMRSYTSMRYAYADDGQARRPPDALWRAYAKLIRHGLSGAGEAVKT